ncbi:hypothetical protein BH10PSE19_BH10PSE19_01240 [soil metagenome]
MDNVGFHKVAGVEDIIKSCGCELIYLPPYSPDLLPIENMWSKLKTGLRKFAASCENTFKETIRESFESISSSDLHSWYQHCGY